MQKLLLAIAALTLPLLGSIVAAPFALADDPLQPIKAAVNAERAGSGCLPLAYDSALQAASQQAVRSFMTDNNRNAAGTASVRVKAAGGNFALVNDDLGQGDKSRAQNAAIANTRVFINDCRYTSFGVGFLRNARAENNYVAITLGGWPKATDSAVNRPPVMVGVPVKPAATPTTPSSTYPILPTRAVLGDVDVYDAPGGVGRVTGMLRRGGTVNVQTRRMDNWVQVTGSTVPSGKGWVWGDFIAK